MGRLSRFILYLFVCHGWVTVLALPYVTVLHTVGIAVRSVAPLTLAPSRTVGVSRTLARLAFAPLARFLLSVSLPVASRGRIRLTHSARSLALGFTAFSVPLRTWHALCYAAFTHLRHAFSMPTLRTNFNVNVTSLNPVGSHGLNAL